MPVRRRSHHLTYSDRLKIEALRKAGSSQSEIARLLGFNRSTICREIKRGMVSQINHRTYDFFRTYAADAAQQDAVYKMTAKGAPLKIGHDYNLLEYIEQKIIKEKYSPAAALLKIGQQGLIFETTLSKGTLYNYINSGLFLTLKRKHLPRKGKQKQKKKAPQKRVAFPNVLKLSIADRSELIGRRVSFGHWEMDTVVGKAKGKNAVLLVLTERKTRYEIIRKIHRKQARYVVQALDELQRKYGVHFRDIFKTITVDNGPEFSDINGMEKDHRTTIYYCHPYSSWERGSNEHANGIIRRWVPKGANITSYTKAQIQLVQDWLNNYPRQILNSTAQREFDKEFQKVTEKLQCCFTN